MIQQRSDLAAAEPCGWALTVNTGSPQSLVSVDVANTGYDGLVEQHLLDRRGLSANPLVQLSTLRGTVGQIGVKEVTGNVFHNPRDTGDRGAQATGKPVNGFKDIAHGQIAERTLVHEIQDQRLLTR
jgi:hypothetical protein